MTNNKICSNKKWASTQIMIFAVGSIIIVSCAMLDSDKEVDLGKYPDVHAILIADDEYLLIREREVQDWTTSCMRKAGFEYISWLSDNYQSNDISNSPTPTVDSIVASQNTTETIQDPNEEIYDSLSRSERTLYFETLWGKEDIEEGAAPSGNEDRFGCYNAAWVELYGRDAVQARWTILDHAKEIDELVRSNPTYLAAEQEWSSCMAASGYDLQTPTDIERAIWLMSDTDTSVGYNNTRSFERNMREANEECSDNLEETTILLRNESLDRSLQGSIDILLADIEKRQSSN